VLLLGRIYSFLIVIFRVLASLVESGVTAIAGEIEIRIGRIGPTSLGRLDRGSWWLLPNVSGHDAGVFWVLWSFG